MLLMLHVDMTCINNIYMYNMYLFSSTSTTRIRGQMVGKDNAGCRNLQIKIERTERKKLTKVAYRKRKEEKDKKNVERTLSCPGR